MNAICFILISLFWGGSFLSINISLRGYSPFLAATLRVTSALILIALYIKWKKIKFPDQNIAIKTIINGAIGIGLPWALLFWGEQYVAPALCSIINATAPMFTAIFAAIIISSSQDRMTWNKWTGTALGFIGIAIIFGPLVFNKSIHNIEGLSAIVGMSICYGLSIAWLKKISPHISNVMALLLECTGALIILIPITIIYYFTEGGYFITGASLLEPTLAILYLGIFSTVFAFILFYKLLKDVGSVQASAVTFMVPIISILLDWLILDKWIGTQALLGALVVFAALRLIHRPARAYS